MFWKWYYQSFSVRMKVIAYNSIIIFCHLVKVAIFAISNFFSLFWIAVFNIPITHIIMFLLFLLQSYCFFRYFQIFLTFFNWSRADLTTIANFIFVLSCVPLFSGGRVPAVFRVRWCVFFSPVESWQSYARAYTYAHTRTRTGIFRPQFLDSIVIFRR